MLSLFSQFNRRTLALLSLLIVATAIPLTVFLTQKAQELRGRAAPNGQVIFVNQSGNALPSTVSSPDLYLKILKPDNWNLPSAKSQSSLAQNMSVLPKVYAQTTCPGKCRHESQPGLGCTYYPAGDPDCQQRNNNDAAFHCYTGSACGSFDPTPTPGRAPTPIPTSAPPGGGESPRCTTLVISNRHPQGSTTVNMTLSYRGNPATATIWVADNLNINKQQPADVAIWVRLTDITFSQPRHQSIQATAPQGLSPGRHIVSAQLFDASGTSVDEPYKSSNTACADFIDPGSSQPTATPQPGGGGQGQITLYQIHIENTDGGSGGHEAVRIENNPATPQNELLEYIGRPVFWKLNPEGPNPKKVRVDFYGQRADGSTAQVATEETITLTTAVGDPQPTQPQPTQPQPTQPQPTQPQPTQQDVADCDGVTIDGVEFRTGQDIPVSTQHTAVIRVRNTEKAFPTSTWDTSFYLKYVGGSERQLGLARSTIPVSGSVPQGGTHNFEVPFTPTVAAPLEFKWRMHHGERPFGGECNITVNISSGTPGTTPPGAQRCENLPPPDSLHPLQRCLSVSETPPIGCQVDSRETVCPSGTRCYSCVGTILTPQPTPTPAGERCSGPGLTCSLEDPTLTGARDPNQFVCNNIGREGCAGQQRCWSCTLRTGGIPGACNPLVDCPPCAPGAVCAQRPGIPTKSCECQLPTTPTPTPGAPTPTPGAPTPTTILPGSTVVPIRLAFQEFSKAPQTRIGQKPRRLTRSDVEVNLTLTGTIPQGFTAGQRFEARATLQWVDQRFDGNLGFFEGRAVFAPNILPSGTNTYNILVKEATHLRKTVATNVSLASAQQNQIVDGRGNVLLVGSIDGDNTVDIIDHQILVNCFGDKATSAECQGRGQDADLDDDGKVTIFDYNWLIENFAKTGEL